MWLLYLASLKALGSAPEGMRQVYSAVASISYVLYLTEQDRYEEARQQLEAGLKAPLGAILSYREKAAHGRFVLGVCLMEAGEYAQAAVELEAALAVYDHTPTKATDARRQTLRRLVDLFDRWGKPEQGRTYRDRLENSE